MGNSITLYGKMRSEENKRRSFTNQSINQAINQSSNQSIDWSINQSSDQSANESIDQSINQSSDPIHRFSTIERPRKKSESPELGFLFDERGMGSDENVDENIF